MGTQFTSLVFHCITFSCSLVVVKHFVLFRKLFLGSSRKLFASAPCIECILSFVIFVLSQSTCTDLLTVCGEISARTYYNSSTYEFLKQPVLHTLIGINCIHKDMIKIVPRSIVSITMSPASCV